ncbi:hypothetical protein ACH427_28945 [Streptomyces sp. NPDC020379]|uniref:hypothetical protein n=1 Tax=Streptomyces sp. NPDC020379 TaxID=3365071 RepID=UPI0037B91B4D
MSSSTVPGGCGSETLLSPGAMRQSHGSSGPRQCTVPAGTSATFDGGAPHAYRNDGPEDVTMTMAVAVATMTMAVAVAPAH